MQTASLAPRRFARACLLLLAAVLSGCGKGLLDSDRDAQGEALTLRYDGPGGLVQTVRISRVEPAPGDTLWIESTITNQGSRPVNVKSRTCGFDLETTLRFAPQVRCAGYSTEGPLAPGDSLRSTEGGVLTSGPGTYAVRLRHLLDPERWVSLRITVRRP